MLTNGRYGRLKDRKDPTGRGRGVEDTAVRVVAHGYIRASYGVAGAQRMQIRRVRSSFVLMTAGLITTGSRI